MIGSKLLFQIVFISTLTTFVPVCAQDRVIYQQFAGPELCEVWDGSVWPYVDGAGLVTLTKEFDHLTFMSLRLNEQGTIEEKKVGVAYTRKAGTKDEYLEPDDDEVFKRVRLKKAKPLVAYRDKDAVMLLSTRNLTNDDVIRQVNLTTGESQEFSMRKGSANDYYIINRCIGPYPKVANTILCLATKIERTFEGVNQRPAYALYSIDKRTLTVTGDSIYNPSYNYGMSRSAVAAQIDDEKVDRVGRLITKDGHLITRNVWANSRSNFEVREYGPDMNRKRRLIYKEDGVLRNLPDQDVVDARLLVAEHGRAFYFSYKTQAKEQAWGTVASTNGSILAGGTSTARLAVHLLGKNKHGLDKPQDVALPLPLIFRNSQAKGRPLIETRMLSPTFGIAEISLKFAHRKEDPMARGMPLFRHGYTRVSYYMDVNNMSVLGVNVVTGGGHRVVPPALAYGNQTHVMIVKPEAGEHTFGVFRRDAAVPVFDKARLKVLMESVGIQPKLAYKWETLTKAKIPAKPIRIRAWSGNRLERSETRYGPLGASGTGFTSYPIFPYLFASGGKKYLSYCIYFYDSMRSIREGSATLSSRQQWVDALLKGPSNIRRSGYYPYAFKMEDGVLCDGWGNRVLDDTSFDQTQFTQMKSPVGFWWALLEKNGKTHVLDIVDGHDHGPIGSHDIVRKRDFILGPNAIYYLDGGKHVLRSLPDMKMIPFEKGEGETVHVTPVQRYTYLHDHDSEAKVYTYYQIPGFVKMTGDEKKAAGEQRDSCIVVLRQRKNGEKQSVRWCLASTRQWSEPKEVNSFQQAMHHETAFITYADDAQAEVVDVFTGKTFRLEDAVQVRQLRNGHYAVTGTDKRVRLTDASGRLIQTAPARILELSPGSHDYHIAKTAEGSTYVDVHGLQPCIDNYFDTLRASAYCTSSIDDIVRLAPAAVGMHFGLINEHGMWVLGPVELTE